MDDVAASRHDVGIAVSVVAHGAADLRLPAVAVVADFTDRMTGPSVGPP